jgi:hypothetical protein
MAWLRFGAEEGGGGEAEEEEEEAVIFGFGRRTSLLLIEDIT